MPGDPDRLALHPAGKADAERLHREFQRRLPGRVAEEDAFRVAGRGPGDDHGMEEGRHPQRPVILRHHGCRIDVARNVHRRKYAKIGPVFA